MCGAAAELGNFAGGGESDRGAAVADAERNGGVRVERINVVWVPNQPPVLHMASESDADALFEAAKASPERCTFRVTFGLERHRRYAPQRKKLEKPAAGRLNVPPQVIKSGKEKKQGGGAETGLAEIEQMQGEANKDIPQEKEGVAVKGDSKEKG